MWIRSERGYGLVYCQNLRVIKYKREFAIAEITPTDRFVLYTCKTKEQALRVLDKIHQYTNLCDIGVLNLADFDMGDGE